jgi:hypothetical protein
MLVNRDGLVFVGRRRNSAGAEHVDDTHAWQMPQGGIDPGEEPLKAARRELYEETSVTSAELIAEAPEWYGYDLPPEVTAASSGDATAGRCRSGSPSASRARMRRSRSSAPAEAGTSRSSMLGAGSGSRTFRAYHPLQATRL